MKKKPLISIKNVWKTYIVGKEPLHVLKNITLNIYENDFIAILGPSGSGKSTLMNLIGILDTPTKGSIHLRGKNISHYSEDDLAHARGKTIGFIFQQFNLIPTLSALENDTLPAMFQNMPSEIRQEKATKILSSFGLGDRLHHTPAELSGGQQQRVAISRSLINDPTIILADEPTGNLDSTSGKQIMDSLKELHKQGKTIILITHDTELVKFGKKVVYIRDGEIHTKS